MNTLVKRLPTYALLLVLGALGALIVSGGPLVQTAQADGTLPTPDHFGRKIDPYAEYDPQNQCAPKPKPGVVGFRKIIRGTFPTTGKGGISRKCSEGRTSEHKEGRAWDWTVSASSSADRGRADYVLGWLLKDRKNPDAYARRLGIMYIIWDGRIWSAERHSEGWRNYTGPNPHTDHVHFSFSWDGAKKETTWWNRQ